MKSIKSEELVGGGNAFSRRDFIQTGGVAAVVMAAGMPKGVFADGRRVEGAVIELRAEDLPEGALAAWVNKGSLAGEFQSQASGNDPVVRMIEGRKAVVFDGKGWMKSSFGLPGKLSRNSPFTVVMWVYSPEQQNRACMFAMGSRPRVSAEFNYHRGNHEHGNAAFEGFGGRSTGYRGGTPEAGRWHHLAFVYAGGEDGGFRLYVNGELSTENRFKLDTHEGEPLTLAAAYDSRNEDAIAPFAGAIAELSVYERPLSKREVRNVIGMYGPFGPNPVDGQNLLAREVTLEWERGRDGAQCALYAAGSEEDLKNALPHTDHPENPVIVDEATGRGRCGPLPLVLGRTYFWRIDQKHPQSGEHDIGEVWQFTVSTGPATEPQPRDKLTGISESTDVLRWTPGPYATAQMLFFGTDPEEVRNATKPMARLAATVGEVRLAQPLESGKTYYWRVASENGGNAADPGMLWRFRTNDAPIKNHITFLIATDQHYGHGNNYELNKTTVDMMNGIAGNEYPNNFGGGIIRTPLGVIDPGDLLDKGYDPSDAQEKWDEWEEHYGLDGTDGRLAFPVYEGIGNHDGGPSFSIPRDRIRERNKRRKGLTKISDNGLHYSWDWDHVHFVQTNLFPGDGPDDVMNVSPQNHDPEGALQFLKDDLAEHIGDSGKPVIIITHYGMLGGMSDWWTPEAKKRFYEAIRRYNVIGYFNGHSHGVSYIMYEDLLTVHCGAAARPAGGTGDFMIVRVTEEEMGIIHWRPDRWGDQRKLKIETPAAFKA